jgi:hypothetical protein
MSRKYQNDPTDYWRVSSDYCVVDNRTSVKIGLNEAIILRTLYELCRTKKQNDGISWWQGKREYWLIKFPWLSESALKRFLAKLEKMKLIEIRIDRQTGNHYRTVEDQIERMLKDDYFCIEQTDLANDSASGQIEPTSGGTASGQIEPTSGQIEPTSGQFEPTLLSLGSSPLSSPLSSNIAARLSAPAPDTSPKPQFRPDLKTEIALYTASKAENLEPPLIEAEIVNEMPYPQKTRKQPRGEKKGDEKGKGLPTPVTEAWQAYSEAFRGKFGVDPIRNARVMGQMKHFIDRVGQADAPNILRFYLQQHDRWTVQNGHTVAVALQQAEKLAAGYRGAKMITEGEAREIDKRQTSSNNVDRAWEKYQRELEARKNEDERDS